MDSKGHDDGFMNRVRGVTPKMERSHVAEATISSDLLMAGSAMAAILH